MVEPPAGVRGSELEKALANAMRGLAIRIARTLNGARDRRGGAAWSRRSRHLPPSRAPSADDPVTAPRTWLLRIGWHEKHGGLDAFASPKAF